MSNRELAKSRTYYVISYPQGAAVPDETLNSETIAAMEELENGGGTLFTGSTEDLFTRLQRNNLC